MKLEIKTLQKLCYEYNHMNILETDVFGEMPLVCSYSVSERIEYILSLFDKPVPRTEQIKTLLKDLKQELESW